MKPLRNISIISGGSRGDIQPYCAIALALERAGYSTRILTNEDHKPLVESFGLTHVHVFINNVDWLERDHAFRKSISDGDAAAMFAALSKANQEESEPMCKRFHEEVERHRPDLLLAGVQGEFFDWYAKVALDLPVLPVVLHALSREERGSFGLPTLPFGLHNVLFSLVVTKAIMKSWRSLDDALAKLTGGARVLSTLNLADLEENFYAPKFPVIVCKPESYKPILNPNAHGNYKFVGAAIVQRKYEVKHSSSFGDDNVFNVLEEFLSRDEKRKPVYMGWGYMTCKSPEHMVLMATEALRESGQRGIILGGWAQLSQELLEKATKDEALIEYARENILFVNKAPHEWLLPRVSAAVHHGGAGTTNASLRAGVPTIITPGMLIRSVSFLFLIGLVLIVSRSLHRPV